MYVSGLSKKKKEDGKDKKGAGKDDKSKKKHKALGKEGLIQNHKEQTALREQWKKDTDAFKNILTNLGEKYQKSKGQNQSL